MFCNKYDHHYYIDGCNAKIPLRWMAWEAVLLVSEHSIDISRIPVLHSIIFSPKGKRSCQTDVWSFAVTVWEICMDCKETPYADLTSEQVLENYARWYENERHIGKENNQDTSGDDDDNNKNNKNGSTKKKKNSPRILSQPIHCTDSLYLMMNKCWSKQTEDRPSFEEIYLYLERLALD